MAEYIERETAINQFTTNGGVFVYGVKGVAAIISRLRTLPAADVVEVVRCGKCVHFDSDIPYHEEYGSCDKHDFAIFHKSHYCGYGEAKMDGKGEGE